MSTALSSIDFLLLGLYLVGTGWGCGSAGRSGPVTISSWVVAGCPGLQTLNLGDTQITDAGLVHLKGLIDLQTLELIVSKVTDAGVAELQKALPNCEIRK